MFSKVFSVAIAATIVTASQAFAWGDMYMGDGTHNLNSLVPIAYYGPNYCLTGLQPFVLGGVFVAVRPQVVKRPRKSRNRANCKARSEVTKPSDAAGLFFVLEQR